MAFLPQPLHFRVSSALVPAIFAKRNQLYWKIAKRLRSTVIYIFIPTSKAQLKSSLHSWKHFSDHFLIVHIIHIQLRFTLSRSYLCATLSDYLMTSGDVGAHARTQAIQARRGPNLRFTCIFTGARRLDLCVINFNPPAWTRTPNSVRM